MWEIHKDKNGYAFGVAVRENSYVISPECNEDKIIYTGKFWNGVEKLLENLEFKREFNEYLRGVSKPEYVVIGHDTVVPDELPDTLRDRFGVDAKVKVCITFDQLLLNKGDLTKKEQVQEFVKSQCPYFISKN